MFYTNRVLKEYKDKSVYFLFPLALLLTSCFP